MEKEYINEAQLAAVIGVSRMTLLNWRRKGFIPLDCYMSKKYMNVERINYDRRMFFDWFNQKFDRDVF